MAYRYSIHNYYVKIEHYTNEGGNPHTHIVRVMKKGFFSDTVLKTYLVDKWMGDKTLSLNAAIKKAETDIEGYIEYGNG